MPVLRSDVPGKVYMLVEKGRTPADGKGQSTPNQVSRAAAESSSPLKPAMATEPAMPTSPPLQLSAPLSSPPVQEAKTPTGEPRSTEAGRAPQERPSASRRTKDLRTGGPKNTGGRGTAEEQPQNAESAGKCQDLGPNTGERRGVLRSGRRMPRRPGSRGR